MPILPEQKQYVTQNVTRNVGQCPNMMAALRNIGGALCSMLQSLANAHY